MSGRKPRAVSDDERALFQETFKDAKPVSRRLAGKKPKPKAEPGTRPVEKSRKPIVFKPILPMPSKLPVTPDAVALKPIGGHREAHLRRGQLEPEAKLDLHGLTQEQAYRALQRFLMRAQGNDQRVALVITGKTGVLREMVPRWLAEADMRSLSSGASPAHIRHGGGGALYVAVKRKRKA